MAAYPGAIKTFTTKADGDAIMAAHPNDLQAEVVAIETELGLNPRGASADVVARLGLMPSGIATLAQVVAGASAVDAVTPSVLKGILTPYGWTAAPGSWTYASATTITVPAGALLIYSVGDKLTWTANSFVLTAYVVGVADTLLTVKGDTVTNFAITLNFYSKVSSPLGFPHWYAYTPTGISAANAVLTGRFMITGRVCRVQFHAAFNGAITFTTMPTLPVTAGSGIIGTIGYCGFGLTRDATGPVIAFNGLMPSVIANATTFSLVTAANASMSATVNLTWAAGDYIDADFSYEI